MACWSGYSEWSRYGRRDVLGNREDCVSFLDGGQDVLSGPRREPLMTTLTTNKSCSQFAKRDSNATPPLSRMASARTKSKQMSSSSSELELVPDSDRHNSASESVDEPAFHVEMNMKNYKPEEIQVQADGNRLEVYAVREVSDCDSLERSTLRRFIDLPPGVSVDSLTCNLSSDGVMTITNAPEANLACEASNEPEFQAPPCKTEERSNKIAAEAAAAAAAASSAAAAASAAAPSLRSEAATAVAETTAAATLPTSAATTHRATADAADEAPSQTTLVELSPDAGRTHVKMSFRLPAGGFRPEELDVQRNEQTVFVSGSRSEEDGELRSSCTFRKQIELPAQADADQLRVYVESGGKVVLEAPEIEYADDYSCSDSDIFSDDSTCSDSGGGSSDSEFRCDGNAYSRLVNGNSLNSPVRKSASHEFLTNDLSDSEYDSDENLANSTLRRLSVRHI